MIYDLLVSRQNVNIIEHPSSWFYHILSPRCPSPFDVPLPAPPAVLSCLACPDVVGKTSSYSILEQNIQNPWFFRWNMVKHGETWWKKHPQKSQVLELTNWTCQVKGPTSSAEFLRCRAAAWFFCSWMGRWENCAEEPADPAKHRRVISVKLR